VIGPSRSDLTSFLPGLAVLAIFGWWAGEGGGYEPGRWLPGGMFLLALAAATTVGLMLRLRTPTRPLAIALGAFGAYTAWSYLSILWADDQGAALLGSHRTFVYFTIFALVATLPWTAQSGAAITAGFSLITAAIAGGALLQAAGADNPLYALLEARYDAPIGYPNASAALWTMAAIPAIVLASRREMHPAVRPPLVAAAVVLLEIALMGQSRGWLLGLPVVLIVVVALTPGRLRLAITAIPVVLAMAIAAPTLLDVFRVADAQDVSLPALRGALDDAARVVVLTALLAAAAATALVLVDRRWRPSDETKRRANRVGAATAVVLAIVAGGVTLVAVDGHPVEKVSDAWSQFTGESRGSEESSRFTALNSPRYKLWRLSIDVVGEAPLQGLGQDNFAERYLLSRPSAEEVRWPHSLPLRLLVHTGLIGAALFVAFLVAAGMAAWRARRGSPLAAAVVACAGATLTTWIFQGSVDWLWEYPALSGPAFALLAVAARQDQRLLRTPRAKVRALVPVDIVALAAAGIFALGLSFVVERDLDTAGAWRRDPEGTLARLDRAERLMPLDSRASVAEGLVAWRAGDRRRARRALLEAAERKPRDWFIQFELGLLSGEVKDLARARGHLRAAVERNPKDDVVRLALQRAERGRPLPAPEAERLLRQRWTARVGNER